MEFDEVELCGVHVSFYVSAYLFLFVTYVFSTFGIYITPSWGSGSVKEHGTWAKWVGYQTRLFGFLVTIVFLGVMPSMNGMGARIPCGQRLIVERSAGR